MMGVYIEDRCGGSVDFKEGLKVNLFGMNIENQGEVFINNPR